MSTIYARSLGKLRMSARHLVSEKKYWKNKLEDYKERASFPNDLNGLQPAYENISLDFNNNVTAFLDKVSNHSLHSLYTLLLAEVNLLLYKYTHTADTCIGAVLYKETNEPLNFFFPVRYKLDPQDSLQEYLRSYLDAFKEDLKFNQYPFEILAEDLGYTAGTHPFFDVLVLLQQVSHTAPAMEGVNLSFIFDRHAEGLQLTLRYNKAVYKQHTIQQLLRYFTYMLESMPGQLQMPVSNISLVSEEEIRSILEQSSTTEVTFPGHADFLAMFAHSVGTYPERTAVAAADNLYSYTWLNERSDALAATLIACGAGNGTRVAISAGLSVDLVVAILAVLKSGAAYVPIDVSYPGNRKAYMLDHSHCSLLLTTSKDELEWAAALPRETVLYLDDAKNYVAQNPTSHKVSGKMPAYIIYTSGTSGQPKGVMVTHSNLTNYLTWAAGQYIGTELLVFPLFTSISFDLTVTSLLLPLATANTVRVYPQGKGDMALQQILTDNACHVVKLTPTHLKLIRNMDMQISAGNISIKRLIVGGENLETSLAQDMLNKLGQHVEIFNEYGPTEVTVGCMIHRYDPLEDTGISVSIGKPINNTAIYLLDEKLHVLPQGIPGEICIAGDSVAAGYFREPALTAEKFIDNPFGAGLLYRTGDRARRTQDGKLEFLGRKDQQVKINGYRIELEEISSCMLKQDDIKEAVITTHTRNGNESQAIVAYYISEKEITREVLHNFVSANLPGYMIPAFFIRIEAIPLSENGKIDISILPAPSDIRENVYEAPQTDMEETLTQVLAEVLQLPSVSRTENIFKIGIDSIRTIQLASMIFKRLKLKMEIAEFYDYPVVSQLAAEMERKIKQKETEDRLSKEIAEQKKIMEELEAFSREQIQQMAIQGDVSNIESVYPMSEIEKAMIYYSILNTDQPLYLEQNVYTINYVALDMTVFHQTIQLMIDKHPILKTGFDVENELHIVYKKVTPAVFFYDISHLSPQLQNDYVQEQRLLHRQPITNFLTPTLEFSLFKINPDEHILMLQFHHAVMDGWSLHAFLTELNNLYVELIKNGKAVPAPLKCSYRDSIAAELINKRNEAVTQYWTNELEDYKRFRFPACNTDSADKDALMYVSVKNQDYLAKLSAFCESNQVPLKHVCMSAYLYTLYMVSNETDLLAGYVTHTRPACEDGEKLLGCFLNTMPIRFRMQPYQQAKVYLRQVHEKMSAQKKYEDISLLGIKHKVSEKLSDQNPFFDTKFNFIDFYVINDLDHTAIEKKKGNDYYFPNFTIENTHCDLTVDLTGGRFFTASWIYSPHFIDGDMVEKLLHYFMKVLDYMIESPEGVLRKEMFIPALEKQKMLSEFNDTAETHDTTAGVINLFEKMAALAPERIAVQDEACTLSYAELNERANRLARTLVQKGIGRNDIIPVVVQRSADMIVSIFAVLKAGAAYLPVALDAPLARVSHMLKEVKARYVITGTAGGVNIGKAFEQISVADVHHKDNSSSNLLLPYYAGDIAYVIYTSGSTGNPKGVMIQHGALINRLHWMQQSYPLTPADRILQKTVYTFDVSVWEIFWWAITGASVFMLAPGVEKNPQEIRDTIVSRKITTLHFVPSMLSVFSDYLESEGITNLHSVKRIFFSGEALPVPLVNRFAKTIGDKVALINLYGPTEATIDVTWFNCPRNETITEVPIGKPISNTQLYILGPQLELQPLGVAGELFIAGAGLSAGYIDNPALTAEKFIANPYANGERMYRSGDLARWLPDGNIVYEGRIDTQVKIRGYRIETAEIEYRLMQLPVIKAAAVVCREHEGQKNLHAYYVSAEELPVQVLREVLRANLPDYMIPVSFHRLNEMPLNGSGKVNVKALPAVSAPVNENYVAPADETERQLVEIIAAAIGAPASSINVDRNYFELGADSLSMARMNFRLNKHFGTNIPLAALFRFPTVQTLARHIRNERSNTQLADAELTASADMMDDAVHLFSDNN